MPGFGPIAYNAIAALPDYLNNELYVDFTGTVTYEASPQSPYLQLVNGRGRVAYAMELNFQVVRR